MTPRFVLLLFLSALVVSARPLQRSSSDAVMLCSVILGGRAENYWDYKLQNAAMYITPFSSAYTTIKYDDASVPKVTLRSPYVTESLNPASTTGNRLTKAIPPVWLISIMTVHLLWNDTLFHRSFQ
ncbi:hypothetical protein BC940DRAFT_369010 [Gongronella butleri]|nr:hypothetical protein BC940DRAFT_369010 [Gongronella butleri]